MDLSSTSLKSQTNHVEAKKRKRNLFLLDIVHIFLEKTKFSLNDSKFFLMEKNKILFQNYKNASSH